MKKKTERINNNLNIKKKNGNCQVLVYISNPNLKMKKKILNEY